MEDMIIILGLWWSKNIKDKFDQKSFMQLGLSFVDLMIIDYEYIIILCDYNCKLSTQVFSYGCHHTLDT